METQVFLHAKNTSTSSSTSTTIPTTTTTATTTATASTSGGLAGLVCGGSDGKGLQDHVILSQRAGLVRQDILDLMYVYMYVCKYVYVCMYLCISMHVYMVCMY